MGNKLYNAGRRKEYKIVDILKKKGYDIVQRTAGSHSIVDVIGIDSNKRLIKLVQCKRTMNKEMDYIDDALKKKIEKKNNALNGLFFVSFEAL